MILKKATRRKVYLRLNLSAPSGAGKTMSALLMAYGITNDWGKIAVIDTENGSASLYSHLGDLNVIDLEPPFSPERYIDCLNQCVSAGMEVIIIDSSSHEWSGQGGCLELNEKLAQAKYKGNTWSAWNETTPRHDAFVNAVLQARAHIITCTRSKMETILDGNRVKKVGMKDIQREGWEYELTVSLTIDRDTHMATASKDRTNLFNTDPFIISAETGKLIKQWCEANGKHFEDMLGDNNLYHTMVKVEGKPIRVIQWCDETDIHMEELRTGPYCDFVSDGITNFLHQVIRRDVSKNQHIVLPDSPMSRYTIDSVFDKTELDLNEYCNRA